MKNFLWILFIGILIALAIGFYTKSDDLKTANLVIGLSLVAGFFVLMPAFIYHRWKDKKVEDYMLNKENIMKMKEFNDRKEKR